LIFLPLNKKAMLAFDAYIFILSLVFAILTVPIVPQLLPIIAQPTMPAIQEFLTTPRGLVGTWNHMILGDLWIGRWMVHDALRRGVASYIRVPMMFVILFFGPLGLCLYLIHRYLVSREFRLVTLPSSHETKP
jgi:hypothetical protein